LRIQSPFKDERRGDATIDTAISDSSGQQALAG
jgi:hypothetical protein